MLLRCSCAKPLWVLDVHICDAMLSVLNVHLLLCKASGGESIGVVTFGPVGTILISAHVYA